MKTMDRKTLILAGVMLVVIVLLTWLVRIDIPHGTRLLDGKEVEAYAGFWSIADAGVYVTAVLVGGPLGILAAAIGSMLGEWIAGYAQYMFAALIVKAVMAAFIMLYYPRGHNVSHRIKTLGIAGAIMVLLYFIFDLVILGDYVRGAIMLPFHILQALASGLLAILVLFLTGGKAYQKKDDPFAQMGAHRRMLK